MIGEPCKRRRVDFHGENIYVLVGEDFVDLSYSNGADPTKLIIRELLAVVGDAVTELMTKAPHPYDAQTPLTIPSVPQ